MRDFVRQTAVLSVLWALCELVVPNGALQKLVRAAAGMLILTALLTTAGRLLPGTTTASVSLSTQAQHASADSYHRTALTALANQTQRYCEQLAAQAGYEARAVVTLWSDGALESVEIQLSARSALLTWRELRSEIARRLDTQEERIRLFGEET